MKIIFHFLPGILVVLSGIFHLLARDSDNDMVEIITDRIVPTLSVMAIIYYSVIWYIT